MEIDVYVKPSAFSCRSCLSIQQDYNQIEDCTKCYRRKRCVMIDTTSNITGTYAVVKLEDGKLESIPICRIEVIES